MCNNSPPLGEAFDSDASDEKQEMLCAMRELADALLDLREHLQALSTAVLDETEAIEDNAITDNAVKDNVIGDVGGGEAIPKRGPIYVSDYKAAGAPFGSALQARGVWHLFRQQTTCN